VLSAAGLQGWAKASGSKGLQVYFPLHTPCSYEETGSFAHAIARLLERQYPDRVLSNMKKELRTGKVFIDWSQNNRHKTTVAVYSMRATERPMVSAPLTWDEVEAVATKKDAALGMFDVTQVLERIESMGDLFAEVATLEQRLPELGEG
jgi:bifunctional non-homologous end joining protein LigD